MRRGPAMAVTAVLLAGLGLLSPSTPAHARQCAGDLLSSATTTDAIFFGHVDGPGEAVFTDGDDRSDGHQSIVVVDRVWKGSVYERQAVLTGPTASQYGGAFDDGQEVVVFASTRAPLGAERLPTGVLAANLCTVASLDEGDDMLGATSDDLGRLDAIGKVDPLPGTSPQVEGTLVRIPTEGGRPWWLLMGAAAAGIGAIALVARRRRPPVTSD